MSSFFTEAVTEGMVVERQKHSIRIVPSSECSDKKKCAVGCGACGGKSNTKKITVDVPAPEQFPTGSTVTVRHYSINEFIGALIVFGIPLFCGCAALFIWYLISPAHIESARAMVSAGIAFIAGFGVVRFFDQWFRKRFPSEVLPTQSSDNSLIGKERNLSNG